VTPIQNRLIGVLSAVATVVVLVAGGADSSLDAQVAAALAKQRTDDVAGPATADAASADSDSVVDDGATLDGAAAAGGAGVVDAATGGGEVAADDGAGGRKPPAEVEAKPTKIEHVFQIALAGHGYDATFGPASAAPYLTNELVPKGALLTEYRSLGSADLPDYLAAIGGQPPNDDTRAGCPTYKEIPATAAPTKSGEIVAGGCVFPNTVTTIGDQLSASRREWRGYIEDLERGPEGKATCRHPASNAPDDTAKARPGDGYATRHNPFVYFHSLLDLGDCDALDGPLERLETDLEAVETTPNYAFVAPNLCNDGSESPCVDGSPGGLAAADAFLAEWAPKILASPAYKQDGLLIVTFAGGPAADPAVGADQGVRNGTLLLSRYARAGTTVAAPYDPYSLLRSVEDLFALRPLARAADASSFADTVLADAFVTPPSDD
jgi:phosphatidylinositol-3-phosphatase